jgi:NADH-quinone oxidoreductase subunit M
VLGLWGVVISAVYMLRSYRKVFMGTLGAGCNNLVGVDRSLRLPVTLLAAALLWFGFFPQLFVRIVSPAFQTYFSDNRRP